MKEFLVVCVTLILCCVFVLQYTGQQVLDYKMDKLQSEVNVAKAEAKIRGGLDEDDEIYIRNRIEDIFGAGSDPAVTFSRPPKYRQDFTDSPGDAGLINYTISVKINNIITGAQFFGISDNSTVLNIQGSVASELPRP